MTYDLTDYFLIVPRDKVIAWHYGRLVMKSPPMPSEFSKRPIPSVPAFAKIVSQIMTDDQPLVLIEPLIIGWLKIRCARFPKRRKPLKIVISNHGLLMLLAL